MNRSKQAFRALAAGMALWLCGGCGSSDEQSPEGSNPGSGTLWVATTGIQFLFGVDVATGKMGLDLELATSPVEVSALAAEGGLVWAGRSDGSLLVVDETKEKIDATLSLAATSDPVEKLAFGGGSAYAALGSMTAPHVYRVDAATRALKTQAPVIETNALFSGLLYDGSALWVLSDNEFKVRKVDASTLAVIGTVSLGQDPANPLGPRRDAYGAGYMAQVGGKLWVIDSTTNQLLSIEKSSLTAKYESDLADLLESSGSVVLAANHDSVFLALAREGKVVRFDGATGARAQTYALEAGAGLALAVGRDKFYVNRNQAGWDVIEVDIRSGQTTRTYANLQPAWLALE
jgi:hypothetical protein